MKRFLLTAAFIAALSVAPLTAEHFPDIPAGGLEVHTHARLFSYWDDFSATSR